MAQMQRPILNWCFGNVCEEYKSASSNLSKIKWWINVAQSVKLDLPSFQKVCPIKNQARNWSLLHLHYQFTKDVIKLLVTITPMAGFYYYAFLTEFSLTPLSLVKSSWLISFLSLVKRIKSLSIATVHTDEPITWLTKMKWVVHIYIR